MVADIVSKKIMIIHPDFPEGTLGIFKWFYRIENSLQKLYTFL